MIKRYGKKTLSIFLALLIVISSVSSILTFSVGAAEPIKQSFENITALKNVKYFSVYEATSANDANIYDGTKSLKWTNGSGTDAVSFWQQGMDLTVGQLYKMDMFVKAASVGSYSIVLKQLTTRDNGWANSGTDFTVDTSKLTVGSWSKYSLVFTAEQRAMGMYIYGNTDVYFDNITFTPITSSNVTVTINANNGQSYAPVSGTPGTVMTLPTVTKEGMDFAGWYLDSDCSTPLLDTSTLPFENITIYAKWLPHGTVIQDFELGYTYSGGGFELYTATDENDTNVKDGTKSLKWNHTSNSKAITLWNTGKDLTVGQNYKMEVWIKAVSSISSEIKFTHLSDKSNGWSFGSNPQNSLPYFGTSYNAVGEWKKFEITFTATKPGMGILLYGTDDFYFDAIKWTPIMKDSTVKFEANNGETVDEISGAPGAPMTLPTVTKDGMSFAGWYQDAELKIPFTETTVFPDGDITLYAKWIDLGTVIQDFELGYTYSGGGFELYTATSTDDKNVKDGLKSLKWTSTTNSKAITLWSTGKDLTVGQIYKMEAWIKAESSSGSEIKFTQLNDKSNGWSFANNPQNGLPYFGTSYNAVGEWKKFEITFTATKQAMGILLYGADTFYFDAIKWTPLKQDITVNFVTNNGTEVESQKGAPGMKLTLPELTKEGYYFAGWYTDPEFTDAFNLSQFPEDSTTIYAKWIENGLITQNFENYTYTLSSDAGFELYTATDNDDSNVYEGKHSLYRTNVNKTRVAALTDTYTKLTVGKAYKLTFKAKVTELGTGGGLQFTNLKDKNNPWSYTGFMSISYIGTDYKYLNEWQEFSFVFIAEAEYYGFASWGNITYYLDDFKLVEVPIVTVNFEMGDGDAVESMVGAAGATLKIDNPLPPEGMSFGGWYSDAEFKNPFMVSTFPNENITLYARWNKLGTFEQDYETWPDKKGVFFTSDVFSLYTATDENDPNVYSGKHSMHYDNPEGRSTYAMAIFDEKMGALTVGEKYYVSVRFRPDKVYSYSDTNRTFTYHSIYYIKQQSNAWTYVSQGPQGRYTSDLFDDDVTNVKDVYWSGTANMVTTTMEKDEKGWLTMTYEITAAAPYIALYFSGQYSMFIDYITIEALPSGVLKSDYEKPYAEEFYNILADEKIADAPNKNEKNIYKLDLSPRTDYIFTASLMKGVYGDSKVYLAWDSEGKKVVEGSEFYGNSTDYKLYSARLMTDLEGTLYLVVEGGGAGSSNYFSLFKSKFANEEDPNPYYVHPVVDYSKLPTKFAGAIVNISNGDTEGDFETSPSTGDNSIAITFMFIAIISAFSLLILRKRGNKNA